MNFLPSFVADVLPQLITLLVLVAITVLAGVLVAIRDKVFDWIKLGDFLREYVLPKVGGWLLLAILAQSLNPEVVPTESGLSYTALTGMAITAYVAAFISLIAKLFEHLQNLGVLSKTEK
jgi:hypothetical protein